VYTFPSGAGYSISAPASPLPGTVGPARAGSFLIGQTYTDFNVSYDILGYSVANPQFMGAFARVTTPGLGTLNAYALGLDTTTSQLIISRIRNEQSLGAIGPSAASAALTLNPADTFRLSFSATGGLFTGTVTDLTTGTLLATVSGSDGNYPGGQIGLGVAAQSFANGAVAQATFGNFQVTATPEPSMLALAALGMGLLCRAVRPGTKARA
jgi:hypothetical protein